MDTIHSIGTWTPMGTIRAAWLENLVRCPMCGSDNASLVYDRMANQDDKMGVKRNVCGYNRHIPDLKKYARAWGWNNVS